jgi:hypothetical protein
MRNLMFGLVVFVFVGILGGAAAAQTDVTVTNPRSNPVLVRDVDNDARRPFQVQFSIGQATLPTVPAGKVFVIEYISGTIRVPSTTGSTLPCQFRQLSFVLGQTDIDVVPVSMGSSQSINNTDLNFFTISQRVQLYAPANADLGGTSYALSQGCTSGPTSSHIVLTGHLEKAN